MYKRNCRLNADDPIPRVTVDVSVPQDLKEVAEAVRLAESAPMPKTLKEKTLSAYDERLSFFMDSPRAQRGAHLRLRCPYMPWRAAAQRGPILHFLLRPLSGS